MKPKKIILTSLLILLGLGICAGQSLASSKNNAKKWIGATQTSEKIDISVPGKPGMEIILEHSFGDIDILPGRKDVIHITGEKKVTAKNDKVIQEFLSLMKLEISERQNRVKIVTEYPDDDLKEEVKSFSISYTIEIPPDINLSVENSFGDIDINNVSGEFDITNGFGKIKAHTLKGRTNLENKFGSIDARHINGDVVISTSHSSLGIEQITGNLTAKTTFGSLVVNDVKGSAELAGGHGSVKCSNVTGDAEITNSHGSVECRIVGGTAGINNSHGRVNVENVESDVKVKTSFGKVTAVNIRGNITVENQHGPVEAELIHGGAEVNTTFGSVQLDQIDGNVTVTNQHGSITVKNILTGTAGEKRNVKLKTSHASIKLSVPETLSANITASTTFGKFKCDFPLMMNLGDSDISSGNRQRMKGVIGDGKDTLFLEATHANIYVEKL